MVNNASPGWAAMAMMLVGIQMVLYHSPRQSVAVATRIGACTQDAPVDDDRGGGSERPAALYIDLVPAFFQFAAHVFGNAVLYWHVTRVHGVREFGGREAGRAPARCFDGLLDIHPKVHDVQ